MRFRVDWRNNYWGPAFLDAYGDTWPSQSCDIEVPSSYQPAGYLAYSAPANWTSGSRPAPVSSYWYGSVGAKTQNCSSTEDIHGYNSFLIGPGDVQPAFMPDHVSVPTSADLYGDASAGADGGLEASPNLVKPSCGDPVECATGNYYETDTDLAIPGLNGGLTFARSYNSQAAASATGPGALGYGLSFWFGDSLRVDPSSGNAVVTGAAGNTVRFYANADGSYWAPPWVQATLTKNQDGTYTYSLPDRRSEGFDASGRLSWEQDSKWEPHDPGLQRRAAEHGHRSIGTHAVVELQRGWADLAGHRPGRPDREVRL